MNIMQLKTFCSVARTLSFTASAAELMISQPAVSRQIAGLEEEIGAKLFIREHNTLQLTPAGSQLYEELPGKLEEMETLFFSVHLLGIGKKRRIKLGVLRNQQMEEEVIRVLRSMRDDNYYVTVQQYDFKELEHAVINQEIDAAVSLLWVEDAFEGCKRKVLKEESLCLAVNREYAPEIPKELTREALTEFSRIRPVMIPKTSSFARSQLASVTARIAQFWPGVMEEEQDCIVPMLQTGIGSALINENHVLAKEEAVELTRIDFLAPVQTAVLWSGNRKNEAVEDFISRLQF